MVSRTPLLITVCILLLSSALMADISVGSTYSESGGDTGYGEWVYTVTDTGNEAVGFQVYVGPNVTSNYITNIEDTSGNWAYGGFVTEGSGEWAGLNYLWWSGSSGADGISFSFEDLRMLTMTPAAGTTWILSTIPGRYWAMVTRPPMRGL